MAEQELNRADVGAGFEQVYGKRVPHRMRGNGFGNPRAAVGFLARLFDRGCGDVLSRTIPGEEPRRRPLTTPPVPQDL